MPEGMPNRRTGFSRSLEGFKVSFLDKLIRFLIVCLVLYGVYLATNWIIHHFRF
ncbi:MAG: hypothetical protein V2A74_03225 [bacterium]